MKKAIFIIFCLYIGILFLPACKTSGETEDNGDTIIQNPSFATDIQAIFSARCDSSGCHGSSAQAGLTLTAGQSYNELVDVTSTQEPQYLRVEPSDAQNSYLVIKLEGRQSVGNRMPSGGQLNNILIQNIRNWINNGAPDN
jgi:hypothetical protein